MSVTWHDSEVKHFYADGRIYMVDVPLSTPVVTVTALEESDTTDRETRWLFALAVVIVVCLFVAGVRG